MILAKAEGKTLTLNIHSDIGKSFWDAFEDEEKKEENAVKSVEALQKILKNNKDVNVIDIYINSPGGDVMEGIGIYNILKRTRAYKRVFIDGFACSIASVIAMAGNSITMPKSSMQMIHNAWTVAMGNANELRKVADDLEKINETIINAYMTKFNKSEKELKALLDGESYLTAEECLSYGLCTKIADDNEDTEENTNNALDEFTVMYSNKLSQLAAIKATIKELEAEENISAEQANEDGQSEVCNEAEHSNEAEGDMEMPTNPVDANKEEVAGQVNEVKATALQRMFGYTPKKGN